MTSELPAHNTPRDGGVRGRRLVRVGERGGLAGARGGGGRLGTITLRLGTQGMKKSENLQNLGCGRNFTLKNCIAWRDFIFNMYIFKIYK